MKTKRWKRYIQHEIVLYLSRRILRFSVLLGVLFRVFLCIFCKRKELSVEHEWLQHLWYPHTIWSLVILQNAAQGSLSCGKCRIQQMTVVLDLVAHLRYTHNQRVMIFEQTA